MRLFKQNIINIIGLTVFGVTIFCYDFVIVKAEEVKTFKQDGMIFVVGKHEPEKRVHPEPKKEVVEKVIVKEKIIEKIENPEDGNQDEQEEEKFQNNEGGMEKKINEKEKDGWKEIFQELFNDLKEKVEDILNRLGIVEDKVKSVDNLVETTSILTDEVVEQGKKIEELENRILEKDDKLDTK